MCVLVFSCKKTSVTLSSTHTLNTSLMTLSAITHILLRVRTATYELEAGDSQFSLYPRIWVRDIGSIWKTEEKQKTFSCSLVDIRFLQCLQLPRIFLKITHFLLQTAQINSNGFLQFLHYCYLEHWQWFLLIALEASHFLYKFISIWDTYSGLWFIDWILKATVTIILNGVGWLVSRVSRKPLERRQWQVRHE